MGAEETAGEGLREVPEPCLKGALCLQRRALR